MCPKREDVYNVRDMLTMKLRIIQIAIALIFAVPVAMVFTPSVETQCVEWSDLNSRQRGFEDCTASRSVFSLGTDAHDSTRRVYLPLPIPWTTGDAINGTTAAPNVRR